MVEAKTKEVLFLKKDILACLIFWIIQQSVRTPKNIYEIAEAANKYFDENEPVNPNVSIPNFVLYKMEHRKLEEYIIAMCKTVPEIAALNERSPEQDNDFIDLGALARNVFFSVQSDIERFYPKIRYYGKV